MKTRTAPICRALGGLSLALLCSPLGQQLLPSISADAPPAAEGTAAAPGGSTVVLAQAPAPRSRPVEPPSTFPLGAPCTPQCDMLATSMDSSWDSGHARAALISAAPIDDAPAPRGADVVLAFAQAAAQPVTGSPAPSYGSWPAAPVTPTRPGGLWIEPVVSALLDPDPPVQPANPQTPLAATEPSGVGTTTATVPPDAHAVPAPFDPSLSSPGTAGTPFKRGTQPSEKPGARSAAPLPDQFQFPNTIHAVTPAQPRGSADPDSPNPDSSFDPPAEAANPSPDATPADAPRGLAPVLDRGGDPGPTGTGPQFSGPAQLPSLNDTGRVLERVATGTPGPGENPFNAPRFEAVALPADLLVAAVVPEPASLLLFAIASFSLAGLGRARRQ